MEQEELVELLKEQGKIIAELQKKVEEPKSGMLEAIEMQELKRELEELKKKSQAKSGEGFDRYGWSEYEPFKQGGEYGYHRSFYIDPKAFFIPRDL